MANDSSLGSVRHFEFDLESQKGVMHLLASVRASQIPSIQKNELRDLIFLYTNGGRDQTVRLNLEQKVLAYGVSALPMFNQVTKTPQHSYPFGTSRPAPTFFAPSPNPQTSVIGSNTPNPTEDSNPVDFNTKQTISPDTPSATNVPSREQEMPQAVVHEPVSVSKNPASATPTQQRPVTPEPTAINTTPSDQLPPQPQFVAGSTTQYDPGQSLARVREIKALVNDKVGNPVNLVDIDNEVGREYMGALLDAMKKINSGTSAISAMRRLESAYQQVEKTLAEHAQKRLSVEQATVPPSVAPAADKPTVPNSQVNLTDSQTPLDSVEIKHQTPIESSPLNSAQATEPLHPESKPQQPSSVNVAVKESGSLPVREEAVPSVKNVEPTLKNLSTLERNNQVTLNREENKPIAQATPIDSKEPVINKKAGDPHGTEWVADVSAESAPDVQKKQVEPQASISSIADSKVKLRTLNDLPTASAIETSSVVGDPLFTKEVDEGLEQLLLEWPIFKKSGLFGTGPKGREHPLFKKVAGLQIPLLLAGRFEGATQEVKQSITDYMNGWRYEQGLIYEQGETFEHYLRRVIRHILDLQNRKGVSI